MKTELDGAFHGTARFCGFPVARREITYPITYPQAKPFEGWPWWVRWFCRVDWQWRKA